MTRTEGVYAKDLAVCLDCGRPYAHRAARPRWAFAKDGHAVGSVHTFHENIAGRSYPYWTAVGEQTIEQARFEVWRYYVHGMRRHANQPEVEIALLLGEGDTGLSPVLNNEQEARLAEWAETRDHHTGDPDLTAIRAAWAALVLQYRIWRDTVPPDALPVFAERQTAC